MIFVELIIQMVTALFKIINLKKRFIIWKIKEGEVGSPIVIIHLKVGEEIKIKVLSKTSFNNNNHYILHLRREQANWRIPWRNLRKH